LYGYVGNDPVNAVDPNGADIVFLNDPRRPGTYDQGHAAILIGNDSITGWTYMSKNGFGDQQMQNPEKRFL